jgi:hypothetical protein
MTVAATDAEHPATHKCDGAVTSVTVNRTGLANGAANRYADGSWARAGKCPFSHY